MLNYNYQIGCKETAQPIRDENCPNTASEGGKKRDFRRSLVLIAQENVPRGMHRKCSCPGPSKGKQENLSQHARETA